MSKEVNLTRGFVALVDDEDYERVSQFKWCAHCRTKKTIYAMRGEYLGKIEGKYKIRSVLLHRFILGITNSEIQVDHRNHNGLDCRRENLRLCRNLQNVRNVAKRCDGSSAFKGVTERIGRTGMMRWRAGIRVNGKQNWLGTFATPEEAAAIYDIAAREHFGEFAVFNLGVE